jgi:hypothetical protein
MNQTFNGLGLNLGNLSRLLNAETRSISADNPTTAYAGCCQANTRLSLYRWHIMDPGRFKQDLGVTMQSLGWRAGKRYLPNQDDMASTAYWYQTEPHAAFSALPDRDGLEII